jgi:hypothetical protein
MPVLCGAREIYENALLMIETRQGREPAMQRVYEAARKLIERSHERSFCRRKQAPAANYSDGAPMSRMSW